ncbi:hypothetical protein CHS0354_024351 [Potamilus streckersoni]|uniref:Uncharacterized protein n=1 Tax=Potamilus streckersoni TaxID=2493646 RepID=A0AAE0TJB8_9BIVA|nr:hypothetical protein CHS0354_024351 [Potamilus streckersoni]
MIRLKGGVGNVGNGFSGYRLTEVESVAVLVMVHIYLEMEETENACLEMDYDMIIKSLQSLMNVKWRPCRITSAKKKLQLETFDER